MVLCELNFLLVYVCSGVCGKNMRDVCVRYVCKRVVCVFSQFEVRVGVYVSMYTVMMQEKPLGESSIIAHPTPPRPAMPWEERC